MEEAGHKQQRNRNPSQSICIHPSRRKWQPFTLKSIWEGCMDVATLTTLPQKSLNSSLEKWLTCTTGRPSIAHSCSIYTIWFCIHRVRWVYNHKWVMEYEYWFVVSLATSERPERFSGLLNIRTAFQVSATLQEPLCEVVWLTWHLRKGVALHCGCSELWL